MKKLLVTLALLSAVLFFLIRDSDPLSGEERAWLDLHGVVRVTG